MTGVRIADDAFAVGVAAALLAASRHPIGASEQYSQSRQMYSGRIAGVWRGDSVGAALVSTYPPSIHPNPSALVHLGVHTRLGIGATDDQSNPFAGRGRIGASH